MNATDPRLDAILRRDPAADGGFLFGVVTTGIYCRPTCPARKPRPENIRLFETAAAARSAGFRACKRCQPDTAAPTDPAMGPVRRALAAIEGHVAAGEPGTPTLADLAAVAGQSAFHLQRNFKRLVGVTPRAFAEARRMAAFKQALRAGRGVADATYAAGFGSPSRVYERDRQRLGMTPAVYAKGGAGVELRYATAPCSLGRVLIAATERGIAALYFGAADEALAAELALEFPAARLRPDDGRLGPWTAAVVAHLDGGGATPDLPLDVRATAFQQRVWEALRAIPMGETRTYAQIAAALGAPKGQRAVGRACATNPVSLLIPCHRAVRTDGGLGGYRWGLERKADLLAREKKRRVRPPAA